MVHFMACVDEAVSTYKKEIRPICPKCGSHKVVHGEAKSKYSPPTRLYRIWDHIKRRCYNDNEYCYERYGGRGIIVCKEWAKSFLVFRSWAVETGYSNDPAVDITIDRIDNDGNYEPSNCQWLTRSENTRKGNLNNPRGRDEQGRFI